MTRFLTAAASAAFALAVSAGAVVAQDFRDLAREDLQRMHDELAANHPAAAVPGEASNTFRSWIDAGLQESLGMANRATSGVAAQPTIKNRAPKRTQRRLIAEISPPTPSNTTSTPRPSVSALISSRRSRRPGVPSGWRTSST